MGFLLFQLQGFLLRLLKKILIGPFQNSIGIPSGISARIPSRIFFKDSYRHFSTNSSRPSCQPGFLSTFFQNFCSDSFRDPFRDSCQFQQRVKKCRVHFILLCCICCSTSITNQNLQGSTISSTRHLPRCKGLFFPLSSSTLEKVKFYDFWL